MPIDKVADEGNQRHPCMTCVTSEMEVLSVVPEVLQLFRDHESYNPYGTKPQFANTKLA